MDLLINTGRMGTVITQIDKIAPAPPRKLVDFFGSPGRDPEGMNATQFYIIPFGKPKRGRPVVAFGSTPFIIKIIFAD